MSADFGAGVLVGVLLLSLVWLGVAFMAEARETAECWAARPVLIKATKEQFEAIRLVPVASAPPPFEPPEAGQPTMNLLE